MLELMRRVIDGLSDPRDLLGVVVVLSADTVVCHPVTQISRAMVRFANRRLILVQRPAVESVAFCIALLSVIYVSKGMIKPPSPVMISSA